MELELSCGALVDMSASIRRTQQINTLECYNLRNSICVSFFCTQYQLERKAQNVAKPHHKLEIKQPKEQNTIDFKANLNKGTEKE